MSVLSGLRPTSWALEPGEHHDPAQTVVALYSEEEWFSFENAVRRWLGESLGATSSDGRVLALDEALIFPSPYTFAIAVKGWMNRLGMPDLAQRIMPERYSEADYFASPKEP